MLHVALPLLAQLLAPELPSHAHGFTFPELGVTVLDQRQVLPDGRVERLGVTADGELIDVDALRVEDHARELLRTGGVDSTLARSLEGLGSTDLVEVAFWLNEPADGLDPLVRITELSAGFTGEAYPEALRAARADTLGWNIERLAPTVAAFSERVLAADGEVLSAGLGWPVVIASVPSGAVPSLAQDELCDTAYFSAPEWEHEGDNAQGTMRTYNVHDQGVFASGNVNVLVNDTTPTEPNNIYLPPILEMTPGFPGTHATSVAGNIANIHPTYYASSYTLPKLYSAGGTGDVTAPINWNFAVTQGVDLGNCSWWNFLKGKIEFLDRFFDYTVRNYSVMMFKSNGNQGTTGSPYGTSPGNGYNVTCTGNYNDANDDDWSNDTMTASSSYWNPIEGHDKPEVASPGDCVATTTTGAMGITTCFGGTSSASPLTCGVAALLCSFEPALLGQMTTLKATLMASAWHNVEGAALLSEKDGAGGVHAKAAHALLRDGQWWHGLVQDADFAGGILDVPMELVAGDETRVIALWFSNADASYSTDVLDMDLDLTVLDPAGGVVAASLSAVNPFELASFVPAFTGTYTVRLTKQRFDGGTEPLSVAWSTRNDAGTAEVFVDESGPSFAVGQTPLFQFRDRYLGAGLEYLATASLGATSAGPLGGGFAMPIGFDVISESILALPGWTGTLDGNGEASASLPIAADPGLAGIALHFALGAWAPGTVLAQPPVTVSDRVTLTIAP
ncbi:MAG: S8 family serine peptidase [Planctomycetota bacterium]|nr:S8 family serine peptidase [Planctomycetota bacterium]